MLWEFRGGKQVYDLEGLEGFRRAMMRQKESQLQRCRKGSV